MNNLLARIRYIKPEFFEDTTLSEVSIEARYLYIGLWCIMDRQGICEDSAKLIKKSIYPYDGMTPEKVEILLQELISINRLIRFEYSGKKLIYCPHLARHQKFHQKENPKYSISEDILKALGKPGASPVLALDKPGASRMGNGELVMGNGELGIGHTSTELLPPWGGVSSSHPLMGIWNQLCGSLPKIKTLNKKRLIRANTLWKENPSEEYWTTVVKKITQSSFCMGEGGTGWRANFDWLLQPSTHLKVIEGNYDKKQNKPMKVFLNLGTPDDTVV